MTSSKTEDNPGQGAVTGHDSLATALRAALDERDRHRREEAIAEAAQTVTPDELVGMMGDGDSSRRRNAAMEALTRGGPRSIPALLRALRSDDPELVMFATNVLGRARDPAAIPHLVALLDHEDSNVAQGAIDALAQLRAGTAVESLVKTLDRDPWLRFSAVQALGEIGDSQAVGPLVALLSDDSIRLGVIEALGKIGSTEALEALARLLRENQDSQTFAACLRSIGRVLESQPDERMLKNIGAWVHLGSPAGAELQMRLVKVLTAPEEMVYGTNAEVSEKEAVAQLVRALRLRPLYATLVLAGCDPTLREVLSFCALSIGREIAPALGAGLGCNNRNVRVLACSCIGTLGLTDLVPGLVALLGDADDGIRIAAVNALARLCHDDAIRALPRLLADRSPLVRDAALGALARSDAAVVSEILALECAANPAIRSLALDVMRLNPHPSQLPFLRGCLSCPDIVLRAKAVAVVSTHLGAGVVEFLLPLLAEADVDVRRSILAALAETRNPAVTQILLRQIEIDPDTRQEAIKALVELGDLGAAPRLIALLGSDTGLPRLALIDALARLTDPAAEPVLVKLLADDDAEIRRAAVHALSHFPSRLAARQIVAASRDPDAQVRLGVVETLALRSDPQAREALEHLCADTDRAVAAEARRRTPPLH